MEKNVELMSSPAYSPDLVPRDFYLFAKIKNHLRGQQFSSLEEAMDEYEKHVSEAVHAEDVLRTSRVSEAFSTKRIVFDMCRCVLTNRSHPSARTSSGPFSFDVDGRRWRCVYTSRVIDDVPVDFSNVFNDVITVIHSFEHSTRFKQSSPIFKRRQERDNNSPELNCCGASKKGRVGVNGNAEAANPRYFSRRSPILHEIGPRISCLSLEV
ncbi:hypothetical protein EVAR_93895_1 [Eumeta japonica]|uniref:Mariner Mos1 transposase n=1 Tax=Eumeta variegata TaxID=151549 RepID=A0A4C1TWX5_EUMVA|nr:hypothetical protein EVAR_93895_1 [Eumeta japonica]